MEDEFKKFIAREWPGLRLSSTELDYEDQIKFDELKSAFEAGWNVRDELAIGAM